MELYKVWVLQSLDWKSRLKQYQTASPERNYKDGESRVKSDSKKEMTRIEKSTSIRSLLTIVMSGLELKLKEVSGINLYLKIIKSVAGLLTRGYNLEMKGG